MNIDSILVVLNEQVNGFNVVCFPSEGANFTLSQDEFVKQYPHYKNEVRTTILKIMVNTNHNWTQL